MGSLRKGISVPLPYIIEVGEEFIIEEKTQHIVAGVLYLRGTLVIRGQLVLI